MVAPPQQRSDGVQCQSISGHWQSAIVDCKHSVLGPMFGGSVGSNTPLQGAALRLVPHQAGQLAQHLPLATRPRCHCFTWQHLAGWVVGKQINQHQWQRPWGIDRCW